MTSNIVIFDKLGQSKAFGLAVEGYGTLVGWGCRPLAYPSPESEGLAFLIDNEAVSVVLFHVDLGNQALVLDLLYTEQSSEGMGYGTALLVEAGRRAKQLKLSRVLITAPIIKDAEDLGTFLGNNSFTLSAKVYSLEIGS